MTGQDADFGSEMQPDGGQTAQSTDGIDRSCPGCGTTPDRSHKVGEWETENPSGVYRCNSAGCRVERFFLPDWSMGSETAQDGDIDE